MIINVIVIRASRMKKNILYTNIISSKILQVYQKMNKKKILQVKQIMKKKAIFGTNQAISNKIFQVNKVIKMDLQSNKTMKKILQK